MAPPRPPREASTPGNASSHEDEVRFRDDASVPTLGSAPKREGVARTPAEEDAARARVREELSRRDEGVFWRWMRGLRVGDEGSMDRNSVSGVGLKQEDVDLLNGCASRAVWRTIFGGFAGAALAAGALRTRRMSSWVSGSAPLLTSAGSNCAPAPAVLPWTPPPAVRRAFAVSMMSLTGAGVGVVTAANACINDVVARPGVLGQQTRELLRVFIQVREFEHSVRPSEAGDGPKNNEAAPPSPPQAT